MRAKPEPTLSDASFLGELLVFPANVRLDWKVIAKYKHSSLFGLIDSDKGKKLKTLTPGLNVIRLFSLSMTNRKNKLEYLCFSSMV